MSQPDGSIRYERFLDGERIRVRAFIYEHGNETPVSVIRVDVDSLLSQGLHLCEIYTDLKGLRRL